MQRHWLQQRGGRVAIALALLSLLAALTVACCTPQLINAAISPSGGFDPAAIPPAPDYADDDRPRLPSIRIGGVSPAGAAMPMLCAGYA